MRAEKQKEKFTTTMRVLLVLAAVIFGAGFAYFFNGGQMTNAVSTSGGQATETMLIDFTRTQDSVRWQSIDDGVMGGVSKSTLVQSDSSAAFAGTVSLANNGGFASVLFGAGNYMLGADSGVIVRVRGDGKRYAFRIVTPMLLGDAHYAYFGTVKGTWQEIRLPFDDFVPKRYGFTLPKMLSMNRDKIQAFGMIIEEKQAGTFRLDIAWVKAYR
ncbi:MAG: CIA30 family protein [Rhizobacter sp.]|nr:CIA30 family protein [Chlorobiales bacterium]